MKHFLTLSAVFLVVPSLAEAQFLVNPSGRFVEPFFATAQISLQVPFGADVWLQGKQYGNFVGKQVFQSPPLPLGEAFIFDVRVTWVENGKIIDQKDRVVVRAGERRGLMYLAAPADPKFKKESLKPPRGGES